MGVQMDIEKAYFTLPEILKRWLITEDDLIYLAENDLLRLSIRVFGLALEFGDYEEIEGGRAFRIPTERRLFNGLVDLHAGDVFHLFRSGEAHLSEFRAPGSDYACLWEAAAPLYVVIGDLLMRRIERDRYEIQSGFSAGGQVEERTFIVNHDCSEVRCGGHRFRLGPIQAAVVQALYRAAQAGQPWQNGKTILSEARSRSLRMSDVFKSKDNWRDLIRSDRRGNYRLNIE
jgi:hypothetical protein